MWLIRVEVEWRMRHKNIILGVSGSVAAYKSIFLLRLLKKRGTQVKVVLTPSTLNFLTPLSFEVFSENKVYCHLVDQNIWNSHVDLGLWADIMLIAPATANTIAKMVHGVCDNMLLATYLSARCPVMIAPAMDVDMWGHAATQNNLTQLQARLHHTILMPHFGSLASGLEGMGRMMEPEEILKQLV